MIVWVLTTCQTQYTWDRSMSIFFYLIEQHSKFVTYLTGALYVHHLWFYKHQHDNPVRSKLSVACQRWWFLLHAHRLLKLCLPPSSGIVRWWFFTEFGAELPLDNCNWPTFMKCKHKKRLLTAVRRHLSELRTVSVPYRLTSAAIYPSSSLKGTHICLFVDMPASSVLSSLQQLKYL